MTPGFRQSEGYRTIVASIASRIVAQRAAAQEEAAKEADTTPVARGPPDLAASSDEPNPETKAMNPLWREMKRE